MIKKFKGKTCVYCSSAKSDSVDHVFARKLLLESRRHRSDPKVPACKHCNERKSQLEHYVAAVLPFGGRHADAGDNLEGMVPGRLARNPALRASLIEGTQQAWERENGLLLPTMSIPLDWKKVEQWLMFVVKGLAWHHWNVLIPSNYSINVLPLIPQIDVVFARFRVPSAAKRVRQDVGVGTFSYEGAQGTDNPLISIWEFSLYGGVALRGAGQTSCKIGVMVVPESVINRAEKRAMWHKGSPTPINGCSRR